MTTAIMHRLPDQARKRLDEMLEAFADAAPYQVGYPANQSMDYSDLLPFLDFSANNIGDPFQNSNFRANTHEIEREVIQTFADLMHLDQEDAWGYVTSGGTEGNMYGLYMARELLPDGTVYFSQDTHYSVVKLLSILNMRSVMIRSQQNGEMDYDDLRESLRVNPDTPPIIVATIGTTMKGAVDNLGTIRTILRDLNIDRSYIHAEHAAPERDDPPLRPRPPAPWVRRRDRQHRNKRPQAHRRPCALRGRPHQKGLRGTHRQSHRTGRDPGHHHRRLPERPVPPHHLVRLPEIRDRRLPANRQRDAGHRGVRRPTFQPSRPSPRGKTRIPPPWSSRSPRTRSSGNGMIASQDDIAHIITMPHVTQRMIDDLVDDCVREQQPVTQQA